MMRLVTDSNDYDYMPPAPASEEEADAWPGEVEMILSAMDAARCRQGQERRASARRNHRAKADLRLYAYDPAMPPVELFTRDVSATGLGFITKKRLPLGYNGLVRITLEDGQTVTAACNVYRCRETIGGWYEGAVHFTVRQPNLG